MDRKAKPTTSSRRRQAADLQKIVGFLLYHAEECHHVRVRNAPAPHGLRQRLTPEHATKQVLHSILFEPWGKGGVPG